MVYMVYGIRYMVYGIWFAVCDMRYAVSREASAIVDGNLYHFFNVLKKCMGNAVITCYEKETPYQLF